MSVSGTHPGLSASLRAAATGSGPTAGLAVDVRCARKIYPNGLRALEPIDLQVRRGDFATLLGPSGCGKSTLLRMIGGLSSPTTGSVALWPEPAAEATDPRESGDPGGDRRVPSAADRKLGLAFVFQAPTLMPWASVERNVRLPLDLAGHEERAPDKVAAALDMVALREFAGVYPRELSGGMQMRVSIARALVTEPRLLLMDEPFGALDEITRNRLDREIRDLWARRSLTVVFVTHSIYEAVFLSTRVLVMSSRPGRIVGELEIGEPHPRTDAFRVSERFARSCKQLSDLLASASADAVGARTEAV
ncbi:MAG TPA: ABC transporter ATP-binding protein [Burkholderiales bacterium]|nr:ABC transporter ATP-binding protein [Burkholderiales bacterium]